MCRIFNAEYKGSKYADQRKYQPHRYKRDALLLDYTHISFGDYGRMYNTSVSANTSSMIETNEDKYMTDDENVNCAGGKCIHNNVSPIAVQFTDTTKVITKIL